MKPLLEEEAETKRKQTEEEKRSYQRDGVRDYDGPQPREVYYLRSSAEAFGSSIFD